MTIADPVVQQFAEHLNELYDDPYVEPDNLLINELEDKIRYENLVQHDSSILVQLAPTLLRIINSNNTTGITKNYAIKFLDILLPHYSFNQILSVFSEDLLVKAFQGNDNLKRVIAKTLIKADPAKVSHGPLFLCLFKTFANPSTELSTINEVQKAIVALTLESDEIRQMYLNNTEIVQILEEMKHNKVVQSRVIDLVCDILIVIPQLPTSIYLVGEEELARSNDLLFYRFCVGTWRTLLHQIHQDDSLLFLKEKLRPQIDFGSRRFVGAQTLLDDKDIFVDYDDFGIVYFLVTLSFVFPDFFKEFDERYHLVDFAVETYRHYLKSVNFLASLNTIFLRNNEGLYRNFKLCNNSVKLFCHLLNDKIILEQKLTLHEFPPSIFDKLVFDDLFTIFGTLCDSEWKIEKMVNDWSNIIEKVIDVDIVNDVNINSHHLESFLKAIAKSGIPLGRLEYPIDEKLEKLKKQTGVSVEEPLTELM